MANKRTKHTGRDAHATCRRFRRKGHSTRTATHTPSSPDTPDPGPSSHAGARRRTGGRKADPTTAPAPPPKRWQGAPGETSSVHGAQVPLRNDVSPAAEDARVCALLRRQRAERETDALSPGSLGKQRPSAHLQGTPPSPAGEPDTETLLHTRQAPGGTSSTRAPPPGTGLCPLKSQCPQAETGRGSPAAAHVGRHGSSLTTQVTRRGRRSFPALPPASPQLLRAPPCPSQTPAFPADPTAWKATRAWHTAPDARPSCHRTSA